MKNHILAVALLTFAILGCSVSGGGADVTEATETLPPEPTPTQEPLTPEEVQERLMAEWRPAHDQAALLDAICNRVWQSNWRFRNGEIDLERARVELGAEAELLRQAEQIPSSVVTPSETVAPYLTRLGRMLSTLIEVVESGDEALEPEAIDLIDPTCSSVYEINLEIAEAAEAAGMTTVSYNTLGADIYPQVGYLYEDDWLPQAEQPPATSMGEQPQAPSGDQEELMVAWWPAYGTSWLLFEVCNTTYQTHFDYGQGEIDLERARTELETEADFTQIAQRTLYASVPANQTIAMHVASLEENMLALIDVFGADDTSIGTPAVLETLDPTCGSFWTSAQEIADDAMVAGLSEESLDQLGDQVSEIIYDLHDSILQGR